MYTLLTYEVVPDSGELDTVFEVIMSEHLPAARVPSRVHYLSIALSTLPPYHLDHTLRKTLC